MDGHPKSRTLDALSPVSVIFVATRPEQRGMVIVGWYRNARLYRAEHSFGSGKRQRIEASADEAVLIPIENRDHTIPKAAKGISGIGQSNIFYLDGQRRSLPWIQAAIKYVMEYVGPNALQPVARDLADPVTAAEVEEERQAGFASNPIIRKAVEEHAMRFVQKEYQRRGFHLEDRHTREPYDFAYKDGDTERFIEVKGSRQDMPAIILTANEVAFARKHSAEMELCIVHSIEVEGNEKPDGHGGILEIFPQWNPDSHQLAATQYQCKLDRKLVK